MIVPLLQMRIAGVLWYQGESNVGQEKYYTCAFPTMISDWRVKWKQIDQTFAFLFVQLAPWNTPGPAVAQLRQAQMAGLTLHGVGMATAIDLGDAGTDNPYGNIHPRNKQAVGYRLKLQADVHVYQKRNVVASSPQAHTARVVNHGPPTEVLVSFLLDSLGGGLEMRPARCPAGIPADVCSGFTLQTSDGKFYNGTARLRNRAEVLITANVPRGSQVVASQFGWSAWPVCSLYDGHGLPALPWNLRV